MPTVLDATVVASAFQTSAHARPQRLSNGWIVAVEADTTTNKAMFQVDKQDGQGFKPLTETGIGLNPFFTMASKGTFIYFQYAGASATGSSYWYFNATTVGATISAIGSVDLGQTAFNSVDLHVNGNDIYSALSTKNATYPNSFNIRYAKGTIATDGSVAWGAVVQVDSWNTAGRDVKNPTLIINKSGYPVIITDFIYSASDNRIHAYQFDGTVWNTRNIYLGTSYAQSAPSAIFVPQSVNGLANGRIWDTWVGKNSVNATYNSLFVSYSDDGGVNWSAASVLVQGASNLNITSASITANKTGKVFILFDYVSSSYNIGQIVFDGTSWGSYSVKLTSTTNPTSVSTLYDSNFNYTEPLFIYRGATKVGFYGTWTTTTISVTQGSIGQKTDKANVLTYAITTDGAMSTITEKVNGVTIGTKTATSGQSQIVGLTQAQWDAVKFGKYKDVTAGLNTLTVEMGTETFTYTFDKRPASDADMISVAKAVQDSANVYLPAVKSKLGTAIRAKGGTVLDADSLEVMASAVGSMPVKKFKAGTFTISGATVAVTGLGFTPRMINFRLNDSFVYYNNDDLMPGNPNYYYGIRNGALIGLALAVTKTSDGFTVTLNATNFPNGTWTYQAVE